MKNISPTILFDLDNTIVDTAIRKQKLLQELDICEGGNLDKIREDFWLESYIGKLNSDKSNIFFSKLDSDNSIISHHAPAFPAAREILHWLLENNYKVIIFTSRGESLRNATLTELGRLGFGISEDSLILRPEKEDARVFKKRVIGELQEAYRILCVMGDRPDEIDPAMDMKIPTILLKSTLSKEDVLEYMSRKDLYKPIIVANWIEAFVEILSLAKDSEGLGIFRRSLIDQYSKWLGDIDNKCRTVVAIAAFLCVLTGKIILDSSRYSASWLLFFSFTLSGISMIYAIRSFTSRYSSGPSASSAVKTNLKQWFGVLFGAPKSWKNVKGDPEDDYQELKKLADDQKSKAHSDYFRRSYGSINIDALENQRLYQLRAMNHSKVYPERLASITLIVSLFITLVWVMMQVLPIGYFYEILKKIFDYVVVFLCGLV